jgi:hypothetical protein
MGLVCPVEHPVIMKNFIFKSLLTPCLSLFIMASCTKQEVTPPRAESTPVNVLRAGEEDMTPVKTNVKNSAQQSIVGAQITLYIDRTVQYEGFTDANGYCEIPDVLYDTYDYEIIASGYLTFREGIVINGPVDRSDELVEL